MENKSRNFGWSDADAPFYNKYFIPSVESYLSSAHPDGAILDIGCGNGYMANLLISKGYNVYGIDIAPDGIEIANSQNPGHFFVNDILEGQLPEPLKNIPIKTVFSMEVIEHLYSPDAFVQFIHRILESNGGGTLIVSTPYHGYVKNLCISLTNKWDYHWSALWEGGHIKFWSPKTLTILLKQAGFRNVRFEYAGRLPLIWRHMICFAET